MSVPPRYAYLACRRRPAWLVPAAVFVVVVAGLAVSVVAVALVDAPNQSASLYNAAPWPDYAYPLTALALFLLLIGGVIWSYLQLRLRYGHAAITWSGHVQIANLDRVHLGPFSEGCTPENCPELANLRHLTLAVGDLEWRTTTQGVLVRHKEAPFLQRPLSWLLIPAEGLEQQTHVLQLLELDTARLEALLAAIQARDEH